MKTNFIKKRVKALPLVCRDWWAIARAQANVATSGNGRSSSECHFVRQDHERELKNLQTLKNEFIPLSDWKPKWKRTVLVFLVFLITPTPYDVVSLKKFKIKTCEMTPYQNWRRTVNWGQFSSVEAATTRWPPRISIRTSFALQTSASTQSVGASVETMSSTPVG